MAGTQLHKLSIINDYTKIGHKAYFLNDTAKLRWVCCTA